jgi:hypothetical protein
LVVAALICAASPAPAQDAVTNDPWLLRPVFDGRPQQPPGFRRFTRSPQGTAASPRSILAAPAAQLETGAGTTGYDSTNIPRRKAETKRAKKRKDGRPTRPTPKSAAQQSTTVAPDNADARPIRLQRPGASLTPAATATVGTSVPPRRRRLPPPEEKPFDPVGVRVGAFTVFSAVELTGGYDTNPARTTNGDGSAVFIVSPELKVRSNWQRHELTADLRGSYTAYESFSSLNRPEADANVKGRIDVTERTRVNLESRFRLGTDNPGSPDLQTGLAKLPINTTIGGTAGVTQRFNRLEVSLNGSVDRTVYEDSKFTDGTTASNDARNYNRYSTQWRAGYELTPGVKPFVEVGADTRVHDIAVDSSGFRRDSKGATGKVGSSFEFSRLLTGEAAIGYIVRDYEDPALQRLSGITYDASLIWTATGLTTVKLTATTRVDESTVAGVSGVFAREVAVQVDHAYRRWLIGTLKFARTLEDYEGSPREDERYALSAAISYMLSRTWHLKGEWRREWLRSNIPGAEFSADIFLVGMRLQR